ncbi:polysaccharide pyruvyl transferase family protein [Clostridium guangxiense]|uniref:polysaccharide pyruvyl transferase family protein n=1 Tax=Clostridium guangxiense TaxID=1662055 RepID=UPI001E541510|nr:polysaccharide pyruvyl transferase family protein [Clostridium guangxiense]MCD2346255.1 polysaccharide pyruvyl transferase family protein [Clostridium guangxiense]
MDKAAIITINDYNNYGNRLQNYATQEVLKAMGLSVKTIITDVESEEHISQSKKSLVTKLFKLKNMPTKIVCKKIKDKVWYKIHKGHIEDSIKKRLEDFKEFTKNNICETNYHVSQSNISKALADEFDYFIVGSDQVWNPIFRYGSSIDFLTFAPPYKRIAYAPSFGIDEIPSKYVENYSRWLLEIHRLSVKDIEQDQVSSSIILIS